MSFGFDWKQHSENSVFVYGTLRPGGHSFDFWAGRFEPSTYDAEIGGHILLNNRDAFPYCVHTGIATDVVTGTLLVFSPENWPEALRSLDELEGYPHHYERVRLPVDAREHPIMNTWIYRPEPSLVHRVLRLPVVISGDWFAQ